MTEHQMESLEAQFPLGCVVIFRRPKTSDDVMEDAEPMSVVMINPEENEMLGLVTQAIVGMFDEIAELESDTNTDDDDEDEDDLGLFKNPAD